MGFDFIDKKFAKKEIKLECECCQKPHPTVTRRDAMNAVLCDDCFAQANAEAQYWLGP